MSVIIKSYFMVRIRSISSPTLLQPSAFTLQEASIRVVIFNTKASLSTTAILKFGDSSIGATDCCRRISSVQTDNGSRTVKIQPFPMSDLTSIVPPNRLTSPNVMGSPSPKPSCSDVSPKRSKG